MAGEACVRSQRLPWSLGDSREYEGNVTYAVQDLEVRYYRDGRREERVIRTGKEALALGPAV